MEDALFDAGERFEDYAQEGLNWLPSDPRARASNVEIVVEAEPAPGQRLLGLYQGHAAEQTRQRLRCGASGQDHRLPRPPGPMPLDYSP
jgi:hypothetical protein